MDGTSPDSARQIGDDDGTLPRLPLPREWEQPFGPPPEYARWRAAGTAIKARCPTGITAWVVSRYADASRVLGDARRFSTAPGQAAHVLAHMSPDLPVGIGEFPRMDGAKHLRFRRPLARELSWHRRINQLRPLVQRIVDERLDVLASVVPPVDLYGQFARPVTVSVIAGLLGVPEPDRVLFCDAAERLFSIDTSGGEMLEAMQPLFEYLYTLVVSRRTAPGDDVLSRVIAESDHTDNPLTDMELVVMGSALLIAGYDTTASMISYGYLTLLEHPDELARIREDPSLAAAAGEELVRYLAGGSGVLRQVVENTTIGGQALAKGEYVVVALQSANRDPQLRADPDRLDLTHPPRVHLGFGHGAHQCPGQELARLELAAVLQTLPCRIPSMRLAVPLKRVEFKTKSIVRGPAALPVTWDAVLPAPNPTL